MIHGTIPGITPEPFLGGREGIGRDRRRVACDSIHLQTVPGRLGEWMAADAADRS